MILDTPYEESVNGRIVGQYVKVGRLFSVASGNQFKGDIYGLSGGDLESQAGQLIESERKDCGPHLFKEIYPLGFELRIYS